MHYGREEGPASAAAREEEGPTTMDEEAPASLSRISTSHRNGSKVLDEDGSWTPAASLPGKGSAHRK